MALENVTQDVLEELGRHRQRIDFLPAILLVFDARFDFHSRDDGFDTRIGL